MFLDHVTGEIKLPQGYCDVDLMLDDKLEILVPRRRSLGLCSTALASYLISLHNYFVYAIEETSKATERYLSPSAFYQLESQLLLGSPMPHCCQISSDVGFLIPAPSLPCQIFCQPHGSHRSACDQL